MADQTPLDLLHNYLQKFIADKKQLIKEGLLPDDEFLSDLLILESKTKKAFPVEMPLSDGEWVKVDQAFIGKRS